MHAVPPLPVMSAPIDTALVQDLQWAMDRLTMVYHEALSETVDPKREMALLKSINRISRYPVDADLHDKQALLRVIRKADETVAHFRKTGELTDEYRVD